MQSPSLEPIDDCHIYISGEVIVHPSAAIAPGVLLQAEPGSRLTVAAGVCIGRGSVLHVHQGTLEIEAGAILGSMVLIVGSGKIGTDACVGASTTIINSSIDAHQSVPPNSLIGDSSRSVDFATSDRSPTNGSATPGQSAEANFWFQTAQPQPAAQPPTASQNGASTPAKPAPEAIQKPHPPVYGQAYIERFMITMFPHRQSLSSDPDSNTDSAPDPSLPDPPP